MTNSLVKCQTCLGEGGIETTMTEAETGYPITVECITCSGEGWVPSENEYQEDDDRADAADFAFTSRYEES